MVTSEYFNGVLAAEIIDHGDGTGTRTTYDEARQRNVGRAGHRPAHS
jgi:hypothetical protein